MELLIKKRTYIDPNEAKYQFLINKPQGTGLKHLNNYEAVIKYSNDMDDIYKNIDECTPNRKRKILTVFDDMIAKMLSNKKLNPIETELQRQKTKHFSCFYYAILFCCVKQYQTKSTHYFIMKTPNKWEHQQIVFNH